MVLFGPSGNSDIFYEQGYKSSLEMPEWLKNMGLDAYEYSCARGVRISQDMAERLGRLAVESGISLSVHAPYYINLASEDSGIIEKSIEYIVETSRAADAMGAARVVLHPGSLGKQTRSNAFSNIANNLVKALELLRKTGSRVSLCPETLGKKNQMGSLDEILELCLLDASLVPTLDFAHLHAIDGGALKERKDYDRVFDRLLSVLGHDRGKNIHIHYSRVEYTEKGGEKKHWSFDDIQYGPEFEPLAQCLVEYGIKATVISESRGTMAEDSVKMKKIYSVIEQEYLSGQGKSW